MSRLLYQAELHRTDDRVAARSNAMRFECQSPFTESNRRPSPYHGDALPTELKGRARRAVEHSTRRPDALGDGGGPTDSGSDEQPPVGRTGHRGTDAGAGQQPALQPVVGQRAADEEALELVAAHPGQEVPGQLVL